MLALGAAGIAILELAGRVMTGAIPLATGAAMRVALAATDTEEAGFCTFTAAAPTTAVAEAGKTMASAEDAVDSAPLAALAGSVTSVGST